ncbi:MAG: ThiF family adenylyltransferase [Planctomycetes bacterium]|nr:ThiF family adenylyltransferase [Planctomycetota bacterium]
MDDSAPRYSRQILFSGIGQEGQTRIGASTVGLVGLGALGSSLAEMMVRSGVGRLIAVDRDVVEISNLHRQGLYTDADAQERLPKAVAAGRRLAAMNPEVQVDAQVKDLDAGCAEEIFGDCDLILDGTDGFETRYLINDLAIRLGIPWIYGACVAATGMTATVIPGTLPCLACLFPDPPPPGTGASCDSVGIIPPAAALVAAIQASEALKILAGHADLVRPSLLSIEMWPWRTVEIGGKNPRPRPGCTACDQKLGTFLGGTARGRAESLCGRDAVQVRPRASLGCTLAELALRLESHGPVRVTEHLLSCRLDGYEVTVFADGRALVKGTDEAAVARSLYSRYIGA